MDNSTSAGALAIRFFDNDSGYGFIINQPGVEPIICLNRTLLGEDPSNQLFQQIYNTLFNFYNTLNIWELVFPFRRFYEDINQPTQAGPEIIILGRFKRSETHCKACEARLQGYRLFG